MSKLGDTLRSWARREPVQPQPAAAPPVVIDTCGCQKGPGCYGRDGWHLRPYSEVDVVFEIEQAIAKLPRGLNDAERRNVEESTRTFFTRYIGTPVVYERCPAYMAAVLRGDA